MHAIHSETKSLRLATRAETCGLTIYILYICIRTHIIITYVYIQAPFISAMDLNHSFQMLMFPIIFTMQIGKKTEKERDLTISNMIFVIRDFIEKGLTLLNSRWYIVRRHVSGSFCWVNQPKCAGNECDMEGIFWPP